MIELEQAARAALASETLKALGHPVRLRIVAALVEGPLHVGALAERLGVPQPVVSQQLRILRMRHLVEATRVSGLAVYRISEPSLYQLVDCLQGCRRHGGSGNQ